MKSALAEYSAMLSIHEVQGVTLENCQFRDNRIVDDMLRAAYSRVILKDSQFENALFDAIDFDVVDGLIEGCHISGSGNDGLDLMSSQAILLDSRIEGAGDKGVSVGEGTQFFAVNNQIQGNLIGVEGKDGSVASLYNTTFRGNGEHSTPIKKTGVTAKVRNTRGLW